MSPPQLTWEHLPHHTVLLGQAAGGATAPPAPTLDTWMSQDYLHNLWTCIIKSNSSPGDLRSNTHEDLPFWPQALTLWKSEPFDESLTEQSKIEEFFFIVAVGF